jgi:hypothetical protein
VKQRDLTGATEFIRPFNKASKNRRSGVRVSIVAMEGQSLPEESLIRAQAKGHRKVDA